MTNVDLIIIVVAIVFVAFFVVCIFLTRKNWTNLIIPKLGLRQKLVNTQKCRPSTSKKYYKPFYDGKVKIYRKGNRHH